ncbi:MAG: hypothetical protein IOC90_15965 [Methylocystis sp.]|nr:hypothetical protein [Methylocystis sp.]MCA3582641.1 hypothetical protein [Methylocystis sp.]MCA3589505.1 hypothetical protein [Methylocystis sp.]MCA3591686.1 hypothetical protein [Methylocystis sp.]
MRFTPMMLGVLMAMTATAGAFANSPRVKAEDRVFAYDAQVAACDDAAVLNRISSRFDWREPAYWNSTLEIRAFDRIRQTHFRPNGYDLIPRRFCTARVLLSNGKYHRLDYNIVEDAGITGWQGSLFLGLIQYPTPGSFNVEWCVSGLDRSMVYAPDCLMARP